MLNHMLRAAAGQAPDVPKSLTFVNKTVLSLSGNANASIAINTPTGTAAGDIIIAVTTSINRSDGHTGNGFTQCFYCGSQAAGGAGVPKTTVLYNILTTAPAASYTFTATEGGYGNTVYLALFTFRPVGGYVGIGNFSQNTTTPTASTTHTAPDVSGNADQFLFRLYSLGGARTFSSIPTPDYTVLDNTATNNATLLISKTATSSGAQGTQAVTSSSTAIVGNVASFFITVTSTPFYGYGFCDYKTATVSASSLNTLTLNFGSPSPRREVFAMVIWASSATRTLSTASIGGVSATISSQYSGATSGIACIYATVSSAITGTISLTFDGIITSYSVVTYSVYSRPNRGSTHTDVEQGAGTFPTGQFTTGSLTTSAGGFSIGFASITGTSNAITINNNFVINTNQLNAAAASISFASNRSRIGTTSQATTITVSWGSGTRSARFAFWSFN